MQKVVPINPGVAQDPAATTSRVLPFPASGDRTNRTSVCAVVFVDIVEYSKKPVSEQLQIKERFNAHIAEAIKDIPVNDRIILDTGDGAAISFLGDPEDALFVTLSLREAMMREAMTATMVEASGDDSVRMGINLGPVKLVKDINGHPNIIGDGINVAQRIMSFARPAQIVVSRSYYDVVSNLASEYAKLFTYEGSRTDKHVREHEIYELVAPGPEAHDLTRRRNHARRPGEDTLASAPQPGAPLLGNRRLAFGFSGVSILALSAAALYYMASGPTTGTEERSGATRVAAAAAPVRAAPAPATRSEPVPGPQEDTHEPAAAPEAAAPAPAERDARGHRQPRGQIAAGTPATR